MIKFYTIVARACRPLLEIWLGHRQRCGKEDISRRDERRGLAALPRPPGRLVWLHAASVGEAQSMLSLAQQILSADPALRLLVTTGTVTSARMMQARLPDRAVHQYIPVDHPVWVARFLDHWRPDLALWAESELWPSMLSAMKARDIPAVLLNARMSKKSFNRWQRLPRTIRALLSVFSLCLAQNEAEAARLSALGAQDVQVSPNLKYAAAPLPADPQALAVLQKALGGRPAVLWASTHKGEDEIALSTHRNLAQATADLLTIIVPRHPERGAAVQELAARQGLKGGLRSQGDLPVADDDVYVADTLGELGLFFSLCKPVVMGGSFVPVGGHNPIEPAQFGCVVFMGPFWYNFKTIVNEFSAEKGMILTPDEKALETGLRKTLGGDSACMAAGIAARQLARRNAGALQEIMQYLSPFLAQLPGDKGTEN